jgi:hypothetical protein
MRSMLERFLIAYEDVNVNPMRSVRLFHFGVARDDEPRRYVQIAVPVAAFEEDMPALALARLEVELRTVGASLFASDEGPTEILFWIDEIETARSARSTRKECVWQERALREWSCLAHVGEGTNATTPSLCAGCRVPDERVVCAHLMKPGISLSRTSAKVMSAPGCMIGNDPADGADCRIGGKPCWTRIIETRIASPLDPPRDLPRSISDELDFLRLVARDRLGISDAVPVPQARSISELFGECDSAEDLQRRLATLGDLINRLDFIDALDPTDRNDGQGQKLKSLGALDKLLEVKQTGTSGTGGPVSVLRSIVRVRNTFPMHTQPATRESFRAVGIDYPPADWHIAWTQILLGFWSAIRRVREALQTVDRQAEHH